MKGSPIIHPMRGIPSYSMIHKHAMRRECRLITVAFVKRPINWRNHFKCHKMVCFISYFKYKQVISTYISRMSMVVVAPSDSLSP